MRSDVKQKLQERMEQRLNRKPNPKEIINMEQDALLLAKLLYEYLDEILEWRNEIERRVRVLEGR